MALQKNQLKTDLLAMMDKASKESWTPEQVAGAMADAIDRYARGAEVVGVKVSLETRVLPQSGTGALR